MIRGSQCNEVVMPLKLSDELPKEGEPLRVAYITWNVANETPTRKDIQRIMEESEGEVDLIILSEQEGPRSTTGSLAAQMACELKGKKENDKEVIKAFKGHHRVKYETFTGGRGCVASTVLSNHPIQVKSGVYQDTANKNKGGVYQSIQIGGRFVKTASVHLESFDENMRVAESLALFSKMQTPVKNYETLVQRAKEGVIFGGDLNCRHVIRRENKGDKKDDVKVYNPTDDPQERMRYFRWSGLREAEAKKQGDNDDELMTYRSTKAKADPNREDPKRPGNLMRGDLDRAFVANVVTHLRTIIDDIETSDHKPVVYKFEIPPVTNDFEAAKAFVLGTVEHLFDSVLCRDLDNGDGLKKGLQDLIKGLSEDSAHNKDQLVSVFQECEALRQQYLVIEKQRLACLQQIDQLYKDMSVIENSGEKPFWRGEDEFEKERSERISELQGKIDQCYEKVDTLNQKMKAVASRHIGKMTDDMSPLVEKKTTTTSDPTPTAAAGNFDGLRRPDNVSGNNQAVKMK